MFSAFIKSHYLLFLYVLVDLLSPIANAFSVPDDPLSKRQTSAASPLVDFQVSEPILTPAGTSDQYGCIATTTLMEYEFANSYGAPFVGKLYWLIQSYFSLMICQVTTHLPHAVSIALQ